MEQDLKPGDYLIFQIESGYGLLRLIEIENRPGGPIWHLSAYGDLFLDVEGAENALASSTPPRKSEDHLALTNRAFESTQVARISFSPPTSEELETLARWRAAPNPEVHDRSIRLLLGLR